LELRKTVVGALVIVLQATAIGFAMNALSPHPLPWVRVPPHLARKVARSEVVVGPSTRSAENEAAKEPTRDGGKQAPPVEKGQPTSTGETRANPAAVTPEKPPKSAPVKLQTTPNAAHTSPARPASAPKAKKPEALFTTLADAKALFDRKSAIFIDARHREDYDLEHVPGAIWLFAEDVDKLYSEVLGGVPKDMTLVTYCSDPQCGTAIKLADELVARGHARVFILLEGLPGWKEAGYPTEGRPAE